MKIVIPGLYGLWLYSLSAQKYKLTEYLFWNRITIPSQLKPKDNNAIGMEQCIEVGELIVETEILHVKHAKI